MYRIGTLLAGAVIGLAAAVPAWAQTADVSVTHAINGKDLGQAEALPVDVAVDGRCVTPLEGLKFGETRGPLSLPAPAIYNVEVFLDDGSSCGGTPVIDTDVNVLFGQAINIVAHLNDSGQPKATGFNSNLTDTGRKHTRVAVHHTAAAPTVDVILQRGRLFRGFQIVRLNDLSNMEQAVAKLRATEWSVRIRDAVSRKTVFGPTTLDLDAKTLYSILAVGTAGTKTFDVKIIATPTN